MTQPAQYISGRTVQEQMDQLIGYVDTRAAEVATDAIASDVAQVHQDMLDADADASAAAASAAAAAGTLANAVKKTGEASQSIAGDIAVSGGLSVSGNAGVQGQLSVLGGCDLRAPVKIPVTPTNNDDAASKKYVDDSLNNYATMVRTVNNQTIANNKAFVDVLEADNLVGLYKNGVRADGVGMRKMFVRTASSMNHVELMLNILPRRATFGAGILFVGCHYVTNIEMHWIAQGTIPDSRKANFAISTELDSDSNVICTIWQVNTGSTDIYSMSLIANCVNGNMGQKHDFVPATDDAIYTVTASGYTDGDGVVHTFTQYTASS